MKTLAPAALAALSLFVATNAPAQAPNAAGANAAKFGIGLVDISYIFKNHEQFRSQMEGLKAEMQQIEQQLGAERQKLVAKEEEKKTFRPGSAEYSQIDDQLATMQAQMQLNMQRLRKGFLEKEAKVYYSTYMQVSKAIAYYAQQQKIGVVLRFNGEAADPLQRDSIMRVINKPVQYQNQLDITPDILAMLNRATPPQQAQGTVPPRR